MSKIIWFLRCPNCKPVSNRSAYVFMWLIIWTCQTTIANGYRLQIRTIWSSRTNIRVRSFEDCHSPKYNTGDKTQEETAKYCMSLATFLGKKIPIRKINIPILLIMLHFKFYIFQILCSNPVLYKMFFVWHSC